jgi:hypothetical protein
MWKTEVLFWGKCVLSGATAGGASLALVRSFVPGASLATQITVAAAPTALVIGGNVASRLLDQNPTAEVIRQASEDAAHAVSMARTTDAGVEELAAAVARNTAYVHQMVNETAQNATSVAGKLDLILRELNLPEDDTTPNTKNKKNTKGKPAEAPLS